MVTVAVDSLPAESRMVADSDPSRYGIPVQAGTGF